MSLDATGILAVLQDHALASGLFDSVNTHEPKAPPGNGLNVSLWVDSIGPARGGSGLSSTTGLVAFNLRIHYPMMNEPQNDIEPLITKATDAMLRAYSGDFTLGGSVRNIDLHGAFGTPLSARGGYVTIGQQMFRAMTITIPVVVNDLWDEAE